MNIFEDIYEKNAWGFGSGHGSLPTVTQGYRDFLQRFIKENNIKSVVDYGCGDWQFSRYMDWDGIDYTGLETVPSLIKTNKKLYGKQNIKFSLSPEKHAEAPAADLLIVKDVLQHLEQKEIMRFIKELLPKYPLALITSNVEPEALQNHDISTGGFRPLDLRRAPFKLEATAVYSFGRERRTFSVKERKFFDPWREVVLLVKANDAKAWKQP